MGAQAGSGLDLWGKDTLINYPPGKAWGRPVHGSAARKARASVLLLQATSDSMTTPYLLPCCHLAGEGRKTVPVQANDDGVQVPIAVKCQCSDAGESHALPHNTQLWAPFK